MRTDLPAVDASFSYGAQLFKENGLPPYAYQSQYLIKGKNFYSVICSIDGYLEKGMMVLEQYDLDARMLTAVLPFDITTTFPTLSDYYYRHRYIDKYIKLFAVGDEITLMLYVCCRKNTYSCYKDGSSWVIYVGTIRLKERDLSVVDISEYSIEISPVKGNFISFGKFKPKPEDWAKCLNSFPNSFRLEEISNTDITGSLYTSSPPKEDCWRFCGGLLKKQEKLLWFAINTGRLSCLPSLNILKNNKFYSLNQRMNKYGKILIRAFAINFDEQYSCAELKYLNTTDTGEEHWYVSSYLPPVLGYIPGQSPKIVWPDSVYSRSLIITSFSEDGIAFAKITLVPVFRYADIESRIWQLYPLFANITNVQGLAHGECRDLVYVTFKMGDEVVLGYLTFDENNQAVTLYVTDPIKDYVDSKSFCGRLSLASSEYIYYGHHYIPGSQNRSEKITFRTIPTQYILDNITRSSTIPLKYYEFNKRKVFEAEEQQ
jgi:hypothetical protein